LSLGLFAAGEFGLPTTTGADAETFTVNGLFHGGGLDQFKAQLVGSLTCVIVVTLVSLIIFKAIRTIPGAWNLRVSKDGELEGLDIHEHGSPAYHVEFGYGMTYTSPAGSSGPFGGLGSQPHEIDTEHESEPVST
jgi:Amt family ammonium transporter